MTALIFSGIPWPSFDGDLAVAATTSILP